ncbi:MAG: HslU--HslV peptidase ATPase subunit, partial [Gemmatimonadetes bacterium]|nr:HslU--HslV peptidase ATPase subunit [Gemmatimonadota bacterium]
MAEKEGAAGRGGDWTPAEVVAALDRHIVGQAAAKRAVAIALRNRWRRRRVPEPLGTEIQPNNILMVGPTGVGKTEIARRLAGLVGAPFVKVEATKYTEVGYVGRDVESIVRDLTDLAVAMVREEWGRAASAKAEERALGRLREAADARGIDLPMDSDTLMGALRESELPEGRVEVSLASPISDIFTPADPIREFADSLRPARLRKVELDLGGAFEALKRHEIESSLDTAGVVAEARARTEEKGIVFIDEIDKICGDPLHDGGEISRGGVQRDILPIV